MTDQQPRGWDVQGDYGYGWETVTAEETRADALDRAREYRDNDPAHPYRIRRERAE